MQTNWKSALAYGGAAAIVAALTAGVASALPSGDYGYSDWSAPVSAENGSDPMLNTSATDGCPIMSPDGLDLYMASNRPGSDSGKLDIWVAHRNKTTAGWGAPERLPAPVNTAVDEFCPTPVRGHGLFFVSRRDDPNGDIYFTRWTNSGWNTPERLSANVNSSAQEWSPSYYELEDGTPVLYFSSTRNGTQDIFASVNWGPAQAVGELNTGADDARPNVRHDGKEIVFDSTRAGGAPDIWTATRESPTGTWSTPHPVAIVNSPAGESRASLSWDGTYMLFGSSRPGEGVPPTTDIYVSHRTRTIGGSVKDD